MDHLTSQHAGAVLDADMCSALVDLQKAVCCGAHCGRFRHVGEGRCSHCKQHTRCRPPAEGDVIASADAPHVAPAPTSDSGQALLVDFSDQRAAEAFVGHFALPCWTQHGAVRATRIHTSGPASPLC